MIQTRITHMIVRSFSYIDHATNVACSKNALVCILIKILPANVCDAVHTTTKLDVLSTRSKDIR